MYWIDKSVERIGKWASWLNILLILLIIADVLLRYLFNNTKNWVLELEWHLFAVIFLIGASFAMENDEHVRVDLFYQNYSSKAKAWTNLLGHIVFLLPWTLVVIYTSYKFAANSYSFNEGSPNPGGLPFRYMIKSVIVIGFILVLVQAISQISKNLKTIINK